MPSSTLLQAPAMCINLQQAEIRILPVGEKIFLVSRAVSWSPVSHGALMNSQCIFSLSRCFLLYNSASKNNSAEGPKPTDDGDHI